MTMDAQDVRRDGINFRNPHALSYFLAGVVAWWVVASILLYTTTGLTSAWSVMIGWMSTTVYNFVVLGLSMWLTKPAVEGTTSLSPAGH